MDINELKDSLGDLVKNVKDGDLDKIKDMVKDGVDIEDVKGLIKDGVENADELKEKLEGLTDKLPDMGEIKDQLEKLEGLKNLFGGKDK